MKKDTNEDVLISQFEEAVKNRFDDTELGPRFETPAMGSSIVTWKVRACLAQHGSLTICRLPLLVHVSQLLDEVSLLVLF